jgi:hypothetical protein
MEDRPKGLMKRAKAVAGTTAGTAGTNIDAYAYLKMVWNDVLQPVPIRLRAAQIGIEFERPRLAMSAIVDGGSDLATLLDQRIRRFEAMKTIEHQPQPSEVTSENGGSTNGGSVSEAEVINEPKVTSEEVIKPKALAIARIYDKRRYRRL